MQDSRVVALFVSRSPDTASDRVDLVRLTESGLEGDRHAQSGNPRQILLQSEETLRDFALEPGDLFENVLVEGLEVNGLPKGLQFQVGTATIEITIPCNPCSQMDSVRSGLQSEIDGKRGRFARVVTPGEIRVGDQLLPL